MIDLPIDTHLPAIVDRLRESRAIVIVAEPGAGTHRSDSRHCPHNPAPRSRSALLTTDTELRLIASAATIGESSKPNTG